MNKLLKLIAKRNEYTKLTQLAKSNGQTVKIDS